MMRKIKAKMAFCQRRQRKKENKKGFIGNFAVIHNRLLSFNEKKARKEKKRKRKISRNICERKKQKKESERE